MDTTGRTFEGEKALQAEHYLNPNYFTQKQLDSQLNQFLEIYRLHPESVLEIGPGNGVLTFLLKTAGIRVTTFDINRKLMPDIVGNVLELEEYLEENSVDLVLAAEVLEHLSFEHFDKALQQIARVSRKNVVLSLPRAQKTWIDFQLKWKILQSRPRIIEIFLRSASRRIDKIHHWEINHTPNTKLSRLRMLMKKYFKIEKDYAFRRNRYHHFFILKK